MQRIDAHQHFWIYSPQQHQWISEEMKVIRRDFLPEDLEPLLLSNQMNGCVLVQVEQTEEETYHFIRYAELYDFIKGVVGWIGIQDPALEERLTHFKQFHKLKGFRHIVQGEPVGFMQQPNFVKGIQTLSKFDYTYDILIYPTQLKDALHLVRNCPDNKFVIDHLGKPYIKEHKITQWSNYMRQLASNPNVYCKVSGMVTEADWHAWQPSDFYAYLDILVETFGVNRLIFGSDWPVCLLAASYEQVLEVVETYFSQFSANDQAKILGGNASDFYSLSNLVF